MTTPATKLIEPSTNPKSMTARFVLPLILIAAGAMAYCNSFSGPFIFDDFNAIVDNPHLRSLSPISQALSAPENTSIAGRPLVCLSFAINYAIDGLNVRGYHAVNLLFHLLTGLAIWGLVRRTLLLPSMADRFGSVASSIAFSIALIWIVHPLTTDTVSYSVNRTEIFACLFIVTSLYCVARSFEKQHSRENFFWQIAAVASAVLGVLSKEIAVVIPLLALLYDRAFFAGTFSQSIRRQKWLFLGLFATWAITIYLLSGVNLTAHTGSRNQISSWNYLLTQSGVIVQYLKLCFWPHPLSIDYDDWPIAKSLADVLPSAIFILVLLIATVWALVRKPKIGFVAASFFLILAPTSSFLPIPSEIVGERRMYLPLAAVVTILLFAVHAVFDRTNLKNRRPSLLRGSETALVVFIAVIFCVMSVRRNSLYASAESIWLDVIAYRPDNVRAHANLGMVYTKAKKFDSAIEHCRIAISLKPTDPDAHNNLGAALAARGNLVDATNEYRIAVQLRPNDARLHVNYAGILAAQGQMPLALEHAKIAVGLDPQNAQAHLNLGTMLAHLDQIDPAIDELSIAVKLSPANSQARTNLGFMLLAKGRNSEAADQFSAALANDPQFVPAQEGLRQARARIGR